MTVAVRGPPSSNAISPKNSPGPSVLLGLSPIVTFASPSTITNRPTPGSPSRAMTVPALWLTSFIPRATAARSFGEQSEKIGTLCKRLATFVTTAIPLLGETRQGF